MSTAIVKHTFLSESISANNDSKYHAKSLMKSERKIHEVRDLVVEDTFAVGSSIKSYPPSPPECKLLTTLSPSDHLDQLLDSFNRFSRDNPELSLAAIRVGQEVLRFIAKPDRQHECEEFSGVWREEFEAIVRFIEDNHNFGLKPRLSYIDTDSTLIVEMPSAVHEAPLIALHSAFTCFFDNLPFNRASINANVLSNIEASDSLVPDLRVSFQNMQDVTAEVVIPIIGETAFSQHIDALMEKFKMALAANPSLLTLIMAVVTERARYSSPAKNSPARLAFMRDGSIRSAKDFIAGSNVLPTLDVPVVVEGHTWCSVESVEFVVWVRGDEAINLETRDPALMAEGTLYPVDNMDSVMDMIQKGVEAMREQIISMAKAIDPDVDVVALQDPTIKFRIRKDDIITKIAGAMRETAYRRYAAWYKKASKAVKRKATSEQLQIKSGPPATNTRAKTKAKRRAGTSRNGSGPSRRRGT
ncbi:hypothetical protein DEU56DRAFT_917941 [Suillus clintonianus]|uniref:uncharacterized protein n=1 Tax=Suillus clintonianus TaxID=1904413 RepID=UPI001B871C9C|nr:uncharacterized protein DEU56DRAFT_917941 [Suillus clintonianus]KAG2122142.1 hypothetical protein DEU56DRAFT_917941 [Suillus clintonianus]